MSCNAGCCSNLKILMTTQQRTMSCSCHHPGGSMDTGQQNAPSCALIQEPELLLSRALLVSRLQSPSLTPLYPATGKKRKVNSCEVCYGQVCWEPPLFSWMFHRSELSYVAIAQLQCWVLWSLCPRGKGGGLANTWNCLVPTRAPR